jgi:hypothetical protein
MFPAETGSPDAVLKTENHAKLVLQIISRFFAKLGAGQCGIFRQ